MLNVAVAGLGWWGRTIVPLANPPTSMPSAKAANTGSASQGDCAPLLEHPPLGSDSVSPDPAVVTGSVVHAVVAQPVPPLSGGCTSLPIAWRMSAASSARALSRAAGLVVAWYVFG